METYEKLKSIAEKFKLSAKDKEYIAPLAEKHGITINKSCSDCWRDAAIQLAIIYKPAEEATETSDSGYVLRDGVDCIFDSYQYGRFRVCQALATEENVKKWLEAGIPLRWFKQVPAQNEDNE